VLKFLKKFVHDKNGAVMVESAIAMSLCLLAIIWMMEFGISLYDQSALSQAAKDGVLYATVHGTSANANCVASGIGSCGIGPPLPTGPAMLDSSGTSTLVPLVNAAMAQFALKKSVTSMKVCPTWWAVDQFVSAQVYNPAACLSSGNASYTGTADSARPGATVSIQVVWQYVPYVPVPWTTPTYSYTATGVVTY
jgi:TadE-like protein